MREAFADRLAELEQQVGGELAAAVLTLGKIAEAVGDPTEEKCEAIAHAGQRLRRASRGIDRDLVTITAHQAPVASDLRLVLALLQLAHTLGLIGNQFDLIGHELADIDSDVRDRRRTSERIASMATLAGSQLQHAAMVFAARDLAGARRIDREDDALDRLNREVFETTLELEDAAHRELALRHVLIARSLERVGDNAVDIAEQAAFLITTELREFTDASRPKRKT